MNEFQGFAKAGRTGFLGYIRLPADGAAKPLLGKGGKPQIFTDKAAALEAVLTNLIAYVNGHLVRDGEVAGRFREEAEALFNLPRNPIVKQRGKTKAVVVERNGGRRWRK